MSPISGRTANAAMIAPSKALCLCGREMPVDGFSQLSQYTGLD